MVQPCGGRDGRIDSQRLANAALGQDREGLGDGLARQRQVFRKAEYGFVAVEVGIGALLGDAVIAVAIEQCPR
jgi:hypothetical protein